MKIIYLIRHSAPFIEIDNYNDYKNISWSEYNKNMILSIEGEEKAKKLCEIEELNNIDNIYASDSFRAIGTAKYLAEKNNLKIKLDPRINERNLGCEKISDLPDKFSLMSFEDKNLKYKSGESLFEIDNRFNKFIKEILNNNDKKIVLVIHGILLTSYLQQICEFAFDGNNFKITFNNNIIINRPLNNPDIFKITFDDNNIIKNISNINNKTII